MATKEHWEVNPWVESAVWERVVGRDREIPEETTRQARKIFGNKYGVRCLEIGAGVGRLLPEANKVFYEPWGVDSCCSFVAFSTRYLQKYPRCRVVLTDGFTLPFADGYFTFVYSFTCFQHMKDLETIQMNLYEAFRVLLPGGEICVQTVCGDRSNAGRYDGYVFLDEREFAVEFENVGFVDVESTIEGEWIWIRAKKPVK